MRIFQYKILNNFLYLNKKLCKMGLVQTPLCSFCKEDDETLIHLCAWCPVTKNLWNRLVWLSMAINLPDLSLQNVLLGIITNWQRVKHEQHPHKSPNVNFQENNV